jgi:shikimate dehydrogenase
VSTPRQHLTPSTPHPVNTSPHQHLTPSTSQHSHGLIGFPLGHSFSISYFNEKFTNEGINARYINYEIPQIEDLKEILASNPELCGLNVTIPYKQQVIPYLDDLSPEARAIGAVNVIRVTHKNKNVILKGFNSDVIGFTRSIETMLEPYHKKALILGTGGASLAINYGLKSLGLETLFVSRTKKPGCITYEEVTPELIKEYNVIVNCTPLGMYPKADTCPNLPYEAMDCHTILYDLIYNPDETLFMKKGARYGANTKNGLEMLLLQAFASWDFWHCNE